MKYNVKDKINLKKEICEELCIPHSTVGRIINTNNFREPSQAYAVDVGLDDVIFVGDDMIEGLAEDNIIKTLSVQEIIDMENSNWNFDKLSFSKKDHESAEKSIMKSAVPKQENVLDYYDKPHLITVVALSKMTNKPDEIVLHRDSDVKLKFKYSILCDDYYDVRSIDTDEEERLFDFFNLDEIAKKCIEVVEVPILSEHEKQYLEFILKYSHAKVKKISINPTNSKQKSGLIRIIFYDDKDSFTGMALNANCFSKLELYKQYDIAKLLKGNRFYE